MGGARLPLWVLLVSGYLGRRDVRRAVRRPARRAILRAPNIWSSNAWVVDCWLDGLRAA